MLRSRLLFVLTLLLTACSASSTALPTYTVASLPTVTPSPTASPTPTATPTATASPVPPTATATPTSTPTATATPLPPTPTATSTPAPTATATPPPGDLWLAPSDLRVHPDGATFYSGDLISFQVYAHHGYEWTSPDPPDVELEIWLGPPDEGQLIAQNTVRFYGRQEGSAWLEWVWDTTGMVGPQTLNVVLDPDDEIQIGDEDPDNNVITRTVDLRPSDELPAVWADARWVQATSACCVFHYITGSAAERDIDELITLADAAIAYAGEQLGEETEQKLDVYLIDRVLGHGGYAGEGLILSYLDRFYAGGEWVQVFRHEGTHVLDRAFAEIRPALMTEGLAVYVAGGHFRPDPISERAAALLALDRYIPLAELADDFYPQQHEIGYLEAAGFVSFLVDRFGWDSFKTFYGGMPKDQAGQSAMIDAALQQHFGLTLSQAEADWLVTLQALTPSPTQVTDLRLTIQFYDTVRRYQRDWDPSAYFLDAWLPAPGEAERQGITADLLRHPSERVNVTLETMFVAADRAIDAGAYDQAQTLLDAINRVLDAAGDLKADPLAEQYGALVRATAVAGYEAQQIDLDLEGDVARVLATLEHEAEPVELAFARRAGVWRVTSWGN
jgi:hypothetical protein